MYRKTAEKALQNKNLFLMELVLDNKTAAVLYGIVFGKTLNAFNMGYDAELAEGHGLGKLLLLSAIKPCYKQQLTTYDLLPGAEEYKRMLGAIQKSKLELHIFRTGTDATIHNLKTKAKKARKTLLRRN